MKRAHALQLAPMSFGYYACLQDDEEPRDPPPPALPKTN